MKQGKKVDKKNRKSPKNPLFMKQTNRIQRRNVTTALDQ